MNDLRREHLAAMLFVRLHTVMGWLAGLFVLVLVGDTIVADESPFATIFSAAAWIIWAIFVVDFVTRLVLATSKKTFLKASWWQVVFLALPFLAMFRFLLAVRMARAGRLLSAAVRGTRSATANLRSRLATVAAVTVMIVLLAANVLYELGGIKPYSTALYAAALATIMGEPVAHGTAITQIMDVVLALYSVIVFATVAGSLGAFFLERSPDGRVAG